MTPAVFNLGHGWDIAASGLGLLLSVLATGRAALNKRDPRAAIASVRFLWLVHWSGRSFASYSKSIASGVRPLYCEGSWGANRAQAAQPECSLQELQRHLRGPDLLSHLQNARSGVGGRASCNGFASISAHQKGRQNALICLDCRG